MEKKFTKFELARLKRTAQNVEQFVSKKNKLTAQINKLNEELDAVNQMIELTDAPTVALTGFHSEDIIKKVVTPTDKLDKNGNIIKTTTFEFIYPETIIPPVTIVPETMPVAGSDYDADYDAVCSVDCSADFKDIEEVGLEMSI